MICSGSSVTRLYLIRHGEVTKNGYCNGHKDVALTPKGREQMDRLAEAFSAVSVHAVYSSDLQRTVDGAERIASRQDVRVNIRPALREKCFGQWEGLPIEQIQNRYREEWEEWLQRPDGARPPGGETYREVETRVMPVLNDILSLHRESNVVVVCHGGVNRVILCAALGLGLENLFRIEQDYAGVNLIEYHGRSPRVCLINGAFSSKINLDNPK
jgi:alpha-ribazole phosphatase